MTDDNGNRASLRRPAGTSDGGGIDRQLHVLQAELEVQAILRIGLHGGSIELTAVADPLEPDVETATFGLKRLADIGDAAVHHFRRDNPRNRVAQTLQHVIPQANIGDSGNVECWYKRCVGGRGRELSSRLHQQWGFGSDLGLQQPAIELGAIERGLIRFVIKFSDFGIEWLAAGSLQGLDHLARFFNFDGRIAGSVKDPERDLL